MACRGGHSIVLMLAGVLSVSALANSQLCEPQWSALAGGGPNGPVSAMTVWDPDGDGPARPLLVVGGTFTMAGGVPARNIATWDGESFAPLGHGLKGFWQCRVLVYALQSFDDDGSGPMPPSLYATGEFCFSQPSGDCLLRYVARWDGGEWSVVMGDGGTVPGIAGPGPPVDLAVWDEDGDGPLAATLHMGGGYRDVSPPIAPEVGGVTRWDGARFTSFYPDDELTHYLTILRVVDVGFGRQLFGGANPLYGAGTGSIVVLENDAPRILVDCCAPVTSLARVTVGGRTDLALAGPFRVTDEDGNGRGVQVARLPVDHAWEGFEELLLDGGLNGLVFVLANADDDARGPRPESLFAGGVFTSGFHTAQQPPWLRLGEPASRVARWDGGAWRAVGEGVAAPPQDFDDCDTQTCCAFEPAHLVNFYSTYGAVVAAMAVYDDGSGPRLYVGGLFESAGGQGARNIARWGVKSISGDADGSGIVDFADVLSALANHGASYAPIIEGGPGTGPGDANLDGLADMQDEFSVMANWGRRCDHP